jgi:NTE family protein
LQDWAFSLNRREILRYLDFKVAASAGLFQGKRLMKTLEEVLGSPLIEDLPLPFAAVATDLWSGHEVWMQEGPLLQAIRASIAVPGILTPVLREERWLVDGGLVNPVPVSVCRALGADFVIAVNLNSETKRMARRTRMPKKKEVPSLIDTVMNALIIMQERISRSRMAGDPPEILIAPPLGEIGFMEFHRAKEAMAIGKDAALQILERFSISQAEK